MDSITNAIYNLANKHFGEYKIRNGELIPTLCPICSGGTSRDKETFAIGTWNGAWNCKRGSCPGINGLKKGSFKQICDFFGETAFEFSSLPAILNEKKKTYVRPDPNSIKPLTENVIDYFARRGISKATLDDFKIGTDEKGNILFPFYRDEKLIFVKHRVPKMWTQILKEYNDRLEKATEEERKEMKKPQKEWRDRNTEAILFGMDNASFNKPLIITEGQIDALSIYESGVHNVVSVPSGCEDMEWVQLCYDWLSQFNQIILFGDSDPAGMEMVSTLMKRLGEDRCMVPKEYPRAVINGQDYNRNCKDANEILRCYGPEGLKAIVEACEPAPIRGVLQVSQIPYVDPRSQPRIQTGIHALDLMIGGFGECGVTVVSGMRGEGKSTISSGFLLSAIEQGYSCCAYSAELSNNQFLDWTFLPATESRYVTYVTDPRNGKKICQVPYEIQQRIRDWLGDKLWLFDNSCTFEENQQTAVLKVFEMCARRYGCKLFLVD